MHARLSGVRQARTRRQRGPSVAVRGKPTVTPTVPAAESRPLYVRGSSGCSGTRRYKAAGPGTATKRSASREIPASGPFLQVWQVTGSNHRRLSRRFYSTLLLTESPPVDQLIRRSRGVCGPSPSAMRPLGAGFRGPCGPRTEADQPTDGGGPAHGRGRQERLRRLLRPDFGLDLAFQDACSLSSSPSSPGDRAAPRRDNRAHRRRTISRCQRTIVPGVTIGCVAAGRSAGTVPASSASDARSSHVRRGWARGRSRWATAS
jgi:hypothetical protein